MSCRSGGDPPPESNQEGLEQVSDLNNQPTESVYYPGSLRSQDRQGNQDPVDFLEPRKNP